MNINNQCGNIHGIKVYIIENIVIIKICQNITQYFILPKRENNHVLCW